MKQIKIFCPATVANLSCGFDVMGLCLEHIGDEMVISKSEQKGVRITKIEGANLPLEAKQNVAGVAAMAMLSQWDSDFGFDIEIYKNIRAGSGIGSSSASAAGAVFGINELLGRPFDTIDLIPFAMQGEKLASGSLHADNVAPALLGGFTLIRSYNPLDIVRIQSPPELFVAIIQPYIELKTSEARALLYQTISLKSAIVQWGNVGGLIAGLCQNDYGLIGRSIHDEVAEPLRSSLIPGFHDVKRAALENGALAAGISGSGPSIFALCKGEESAQHVAEAMNNIYLKMGLPCDRHVSKVNPDGTKIIN